MKDPFAVPNFTLRGIFGDFRSKNTKICQKISKVANFFAPQGRIPGPILVKFMSYMRLVCLRNVLKFGAIWFINDKFVGKKIAMGHFPQNFRSPLAPKLLVGHKKSRWSKNGTDMLYPHAKFGGHLPMHGGETGKNGCFLFVFLYVMLTVCVSLNYRRAHCEGHIVDIYGSILRSFQRFLRRKNALSNFSKYLNYITRWHHICLGIRSKFGNFQNSNDKVCAHDFHHLGEG